MTEEGTRPPPTASSATARSATASTRPALIATDADTDEEVIEGFATLIRDHGDDLVALVAAAPDEIEADVAKGVEASRRALRVAGPTP
ncbi:MAG: hypothetical protein ACRDZ3_02775 [Acidimicrobiia bacterium]